jgi:hypothetical protein
MVDHQVATNFPTSLDALSNPAGTDSLSGHAQQHANTNDALEALQSKVGVDGSADPDSLDYKIYQLETEVSNIGNNENTMQTLLGLEGNNDLTVNGIENKTTVDYFNKNDYRTVKYTLQISKNSSYYTSEILLLNDGTNINIAESNIISNTDEYLATVTFEENSGIINLCVTPVSGEITARYVRSALKI